MRRLPPERAPRGVRALIAVLLFAVTVGPTGLRAQSPSAPLLERSGDAALADGRYFEAIEAYRLALEQNPNYRDAIVGIAEAYYWLGEYDQATLFSERARRLAGTDPSVLNLSGRIAIGRGDLDSAGEIFQSVLSREPNNVDATIGRAELALARGQSVEAAVSLERALRLSPEHRKALLSLVLIYEHLGDDAAARSYLDIARSVHRDRPEVHVLAAEYHLRAGELEEAAVAARTAQAIDPDNRAARALRARLAVLQESYLEARTIAEEVIADNRMDADAWYVRAVASYRLGEIDQAVTSVRTALRIRPHDELIRMWAEWLAMESLELDSEVRDELAAVRARDAAELRASFRYDRAEQAYRRALQLAPIDLELRREYAELFRLRGYAASFLQELELLEREGYDEPGFAATVDVYRDAQSGSVAARWDSDQFTRERTAHRIGLYLRAPLAVRLPDAEAAVLSFVSRAMQAQERVTVAGSGIVDGYADAFSLARSQDVDYFILVDVLMTPDAFRVTGDVHVGRTGAPAAELRTVRSGPGSAAASVDAFVDDVAAAVPFRASILERDGSRVLVDAGARDGIDVGDEFVIVEPRGVLLAADALRFDVAEAQIVGTLVIEAVDDLVATGSIARRGLTDRVSVEDAVLAAPEDDSDEQGPRDTGDGGSRGTNAAQDDLFPLLYERVRRLR